MVILLALLGIIQQKPNAMKTLNKSFLFFLLFGALSFPLFAQAQAPLLVQGNSLQKDSLISDLNWLEKALTNVHPGLYRYNSEAEIKQHLEQLKGKMYDGISEAEFVKYLSQTVMKIRCGHTYVNPWNMKKSIRGRLYGGEIFFPIGFKVVDKKMIVTHNASEVSEIKTGTEIVAINGFSAATIYDSLATVTQRDGNNLSPLNQYISLDDFRVYDWQRFDLYFPIFFPMTEPVFEVNYKVFGSEEVKSVQVKAMDKLTRENTMKERYGSEVLENKEWSLEIKDNQTAVMRLGTFAIWNWKDFSYKNWFKESFEKLEKENIQKLIIDIRGNGGGLSDPKDELLSYLTSTKIEKENDVDVLLRTTKADASLKPYSDTWNKFVFKGIPGFMVSKREDGFFRLKKQTGTVIKPKKNGFKGEVFLLGGASNVSATFDLLDTVQKYELGTVVGETSGGNKQGINGGEYIFFYMPYSGMEVDIPLQFYSRKGNPEDAGLEPDVYITETQKSIAEGVDPAMEYALGN